LLIKKILNNSLVLVNDGDEEKIIMGKGVGFSSHIGEKVDIKKIEKIFSLEKKNTLQNYERLAMEIPEIYFEIAGEIVERANKEFTGIFNAQLFLSLTDHISYSVERVNKGIVLQNRLIWDIKAFYSKEFTVGLWALTLIKEKIGIQLPEEEASNIAFYLVNAQSSALKMGETILSITMLKEILNIIQYHTNHLLNKDDLHYLRLVTHIQFFVQRVLEGKMLKNREIFLLNQYVRLYPSETKCLEKINQYVKNCVGKDISVDEKFYLLIHIIRNVQELDGTDEY
jgi:beta-glucoside operon transcriptional antiterminator